MIDWLSAKLADYVAKNDDSADREILQYGYGLLLNELISEIALAVAALVAGVFWQYLFTVALYKSMRLVVGGSHANSRAVCFITYSIVLFGGIFLARTVIIPSVFVAALFIMNVILVLLYAPGDTRQQPIFEGRLKRKIGGLLLLGVFFGLSLFVKAPFYLSNALVIMPTINCVCVHPIVYRLFGCEKSDSKEGSSS